MSFVKFSGEDATWVRFADSRIYIGDVVDESKSSSMGVGLAHFGAGEEMPWTPSYDEAIVVLSGEFTVERGSERITAARGEIAWVRPGPEVIFRAGDEPVTLAFASHPVWKHSEAAAAASSVLHPVGLAEVEGVIR
ncbi:cupin [Pseudonocardia nematodicida]|uniref:Cupin n=1 Tax=Pseudonocardia nematodicida TaxID=1206997 RepID=A0ABV1KEF9_9PSEU